MQPAGTYRNKSSYRESSQGPFFRSLLMLSVENRLGYLKTWRLLYFFIAPRISAALMLAAVNTLDLIIRPAKDFILTRMARRLEKLPTLVLECFKFVDPNVIFQTKKILRSIHFIRMFYPPSLIKEWSNINTRTAVTAAALVAHLWDCKKESISTFQKQSEAKKNPPKFFQSATARLVYHLVG